MSRNRSGAGARRRKFIAKHGRPPNRAETDRAQRCFNKRRYADAETAQRSVEQMLAERPEYMTRGLNVYRCGRLDRDGHEHWHVGKGKFVLEVGTP